jgi:4-amino-4-deoxy-L-arabinose transferase-like glycosyltransferase
MPKLKYIFTVFLLIIIILIGTGFRFINLNWDSGHFLHPDERLYINTSVAQLPSSWKEFLSPNSPLNPHMFYYGALPLYVYNLVLLLFKYIRPDTNWPFILISRGISASLSSLTIVLLFFTAKRLFSVKSAVIATVLFSFSIGSIQYAHFNTTESALTFQAVLMTYLAISYIQSITRTQRLWISVGLGALLGSAFATKITGLSFGLIPAAAFLVYLINNWSNGSRLKLFLSLIADGLILLGLTGIVGFIGSPYNVIDYPSFYREQEYMQGVTWGKYKPPFAIIYEFTVPYVYQLIQVLPWYLSPLTLLVSLIGWTIMLIKSIKNRPLLIILLWPTVYFLTTGIWYAKFARYMVPLLPFFCLYTAYLIELLMEKLQVLVALLLTAVVSIQCVYAVGFVKSIYTHPNTRVVASEWIYDNVPVNSHIAGEHWDDSLPLETNGNARNKYIISELKVYDQDDPAKINALLQTVSQSDYIIFSSRRVFYSIEKNPQLYPFTSRFYRQLFNGNLGFKLTKKFTQYPQLFGVILNDDSADETFQSYDHPPVNIFRNTAHYSPAQLRTLIQN